MEYDADANAMTASSSSTRKALRCCASARDFDEIYHQNNKNFQPRLGFAWDPFRHGKTVVRGAYAILVDQPMTSVVTGASANPPLAIPLTFSGPIRLDNAINLARAAGLAPQTVDHGFDNAYVQSWNLNVQRELTTNLALMAGYFGSKGTHLILRRNINQPVNGVRPYRGAFGVEPDPAGRAAWQHYPGREHWQLKLQRAVGDGEPAVSARPRVQRLLHLVEVARLQLAQFAGHRCAEQL